MDTNEKQTKPLILELNEAEQDMIEVVNKALRIRNIPCYLLEPIFAKIYSQLKEGSKQELTIAKAQMETQTKKKE